MFGPEGQVANFVTIVYEFRKPIKGFSVGGRTPEWTPVEQRWIFISARHYSNRIY